MSAVGKYILTVSVSAVIVSIILTIVGSKSITGHYIRLLSGLFLIVAILSPLLELRFDAISEYFSSIDIDASIAVKDGIESGCKQKISIIKEQAEAYLLERAKRIEADITVDIDFSGDHEIAPTGITIYGEVSPYTKRQLMDIISSDLGIPEDAQKWN